MFTWTSLLFFLCSALMPALCCDWIRHYGHLSNSSRTLIRLMGDQLIQEKSPVLFPKDLYTKIRNDEVQSQLVFIRDSLKLILKLYCHGNLSSVTWDTEKTREFLRTIDKQIDGLNTCVSTNRQSDRGLRRYYRKLARRTLDRTGGSAESWELIRKETKLHLDQLEMLISFIRSRSTPTQEQH